MTASENRTADTAAERGPARILVVDDEPSMRQMLAIVLKREGYDVVLAENGRMAVAALERGPFDVDAERVAYWIGKGAQPSDSVRTLIARHLTPAPAVAAPAVADAQ